MTGVMALYQKELWHYFRSPIAYFVVSVFLIGTGYFYTSDILLNEVIDGDPDSLPGLIPEQHMEQKRAKQLLAQIDELF